MAFLLGSGAALIVLTCRFASGGPMNGQRRHNGTFLQPPTRALHPTADRSWWHWRPGWHRGAIRTGALAAAAAIVYGLAADLAVTIRCLAAVTAGGVGYVAWRLGRGAVRWYRACAWDRDHPWRSAGEAVTLPWRHYWHYRRPLRYALTEELGALPRRVRVAFDRSEVSVRLPVDFTGADKACDGVTRAVTAKLALEAADPAWKLHGARPRVRFTLTAPPPGLLTWEDMAADIKSAKPHELVSGGGKKDSVVRVSLELDSPHFGIVSGTGGGKSTLAAFWLLQALQRGDIALMLDAKRFSHPWTFKDMDAEYDQLPNVAYCRTVSDLHDAMVWLGVELGRRNGVAERTINAKGDVRGDVGPRLWIIGEEMNLAHGALKQHWAAIRDRDDPKKSPAFTGLGAVSFAGRAVKMHLVPIGQMLKAEVLGGGDVRENIGVRMLTRYTANSWKMQAGDIPMPPPSRVPGRWQQIASGEVTEVQVPWVDMEQARDLAVAGTVTSCPAGMPGRAGAVSVQPPALPPGASGQRIVQGTVEEVAVGMTVAEAVADGIFGPLSVESAARRVRRAGLEPTGKRGDGSFTYARADHFAAARDRRRKETAS
jgi:hypothetical protein